MQQLTDPYRRTRFVSWRWKLMLPLFALVLIGAMVSAYLVADLPQVAETNAYAADARLQLIRLLSTATAGGVVIIVFVGINLFLGRVNRVTQVVEKLSYGNAKARTGMMPTDEVGALGRAIDVYAEKMQEQQDTLQASLRRQRRETEHLTAVLQAIPNGVIVQDLDGRVVLINDQAREMLGSKAVFRSSDFDKLTAAVTDALGPALGPGLFALGDPQRIDANNRALSAQAAAVMSLTNQRVGTVVILRDMSEDVRREQSREAVINKLTTDVHAPLLAMAHSAAGDRRPMGLFAREMTRHAVALQKLLVEMHELTAHLDSNTMARRQRPLTVDTLVWAVANEWKQVAQAANLALQVRIECHGMVILGDERRLRWALGNLIDNAIKYTPSGGSLTLEVSNEVKGHTYIRVKDTGVGISAADMPKVFERFFRGTPMTRSGLYLQAPGSGQGLTIARQIIEAHGGQLRLKSVEYEGTSVYVSLPLTTSVPSRPIPTQLEMEGETIPLTIPLEARRAQ